MVGLPNPCVRREKLVRPGYGLFGSLAFMLLGPPTALSIACSSEMTSLCVSVCVREWQQSEYVKRVVATVETDFLHHCCEFVVALLNTFHCCYVHSMSIYRALPLSTASRG